MPINITEQIEKENCECITESVFINPKAKTFNDSQLSKLKEEIPIWAEKILKIFQIKTKLI